MTLKEKADAIEAKYKNSRRDYFKYDIDWVKYILWTIICLFGGALIGMYITKIIYGI
jgi:hypothetical protein